MQCKQWRSQNVDMSVVREMFGVLIDKSASKVVIVCCGGFTHDAEAFAQNKSIELIGSALLDFIKGVHANPQSVVVNSDSVEVKQNTETSCPKCGNHLVERPAKRGVNVGNRFLGCSAFPRCRFTTEISEKDIRIQIP